MVGDVEGARTRVGPDDISMPISPLSDAFVLMAGAVLYVCAGLVLPSSLRAGSQLTRA